MTNEHVQPSSTRHNDLVVLDRKSGVANVNGNEALYDKLLSEFCVNHSRDAIALREALREDDTETAHRIAHTLKGVGGTLGATRLARTAAEVDGWLKKGCLPDVDLLTNLARAIDQVAAVGNSHSQDNRCCDTVETGTVTAAELGELRLLLQEMNPEAEDKLAPLIPALVNIDPGLTEELERQIGKFDFEAALVSLDRVERSMAS